MAVQMQVTRTQFGTGPDGSALVATTWESGPRPPESVPEWAEQQAARLGLATSFPAGRVAVALLLAADDAAVAAAVASGRDLDEQGRYAVLQVLEAWRGNACEGYPPAAGLADRLCRAWTGRHGAEPPRRRGA